MENSAAKATSGDAKGSVKEALGKVTGDVRLEAEGRADLIEGRAQKKATAIKAPGGQASENETDA